MLGSWNVPGDYNPAAALPVWPALLGCVFHFTGVSLAAARALSVALSVATIGLVFLLARRFAGRHSEVAATVAALLLAASPFSFAFSRLAILETPVSFEFCLILLAASFATPNRIWLLATLPVLIAAMLLTKTTAAVLLPAIFWVVWDAIRSKMRSRPWSFLAALLLVLLIPAALWKAYAALIAHSPFAADYQYFFENNAMQDIDWSRTTSTLEDLFRNCFWVDRILYPLGLGVLFWSILFQRKLWRNPLFTASWLALGGQGAFLFSRQDDFAPRYFLWMLIPLVLIVALALDEAQSLHRPARTAFALALSAALLINTTTIADFLVHRTCQFTEAARSIRQIVLGSPPAQNHWLLGISGSQLSLMTGIPSISDGYGTEDIAEKLKRYHPGWYLAWNDAIDDTTRSLYDLQPVAAYPVFDDPERNRLLLFRMTPKRAVPANPK